MLCYPPPPRGKGSFCNGSSNFLHRSFLESSEKNWVGDLTNALLAKGDVIVIDWGKGATSFVAGGNARLVGAQVAYLLKYILRRSIVSQENIHIIGFSLGAHVAGYTGRRLIKDGYKLGRITGRFRI